jgi:hypothetical protein
MIPHEEALCRIDSVATFPPSDILSHYTAREWQFGYDLTVDRQEPGP